MLRSQLLAELDNVVQLVDSARGELLDLKDRAERGSSRRAHLDRAISALLNAAADVVWVSIECGGATRPPDGGRPPEQGPMTSALGLAPQSPVDECLADLRSLVEVGAAGR